MNSAIESFDGKRSVVRNINNKDITKHKTNDLYYIMILKILGIGDEEKPFYV